VIEVGAGAGDLAARLFASADSQRPTVEYLGTDISPEQIGKARDQYPSLKFQVANACDLPFSDNSADLVLACEVFEHLDDPATALEEASRVARRFVLISVPWEPVWRILNMARGKYLSHWGNTPGHVQHFSRNAIRSLVRRRCEIVAERRPLPWTMLLCQV
jgi:ubiquinone/menaquinone biosynthesis C-methylase UbiE